MTALAAMTVSVSLPSLSPKIRNLVSSDLDAFYRIIMKKLIRKEILAGLVIAL